jgi:hypothetical protein
MKFRDAKKLKVGDEIQVNAHDSRDTCATYPATILGIGTMHLPLSGPELLIFLVFTGLGSAQRFTYVDHRDLPNYANKTGAFSKVFSSDEYVEESFGSQAGIKELYEESESEEFDFEGFDSVSRYYPDTV